ncbi:MAG: hypothetical protein ACETWQ_11995 [Phycisphaerae bacterium]
MRNKKKYRDTASFGRRQEYSVIAELLKRDFDVYMTLVDDQGIDCVIRLNDKRYLDIQIKARSKEAKQWNFFAAMSFGVRDNFYFIFYTEKNNNFWVMPPKDVKKLGIENKSGKNAGKISLSLPKTESGDKASKFDKYKNEKGFAALRG